MSWLRRNALRLAFAASATWMVVGLFMEHLFSWIPDHASRSAIENAVVVLVALACIGITWAIAHRRPGFLVPPAGRSARFWITRCILLPLVAGIFLAIVSGLAAYAQLRLTGDPAHSQYGVSVAWAVVWYPMFLAPIVSVMALWHAAVRKK